MRNQSALSSCRCKRYDPGGFLDRTHCTPQVGRALEFWKSGIQPDPKGLDEFSKDNYGDKYELSGKGKTTKHIRRATLFIKTLQQMKNEDWEYLIDEAREWIDKTRIRATSTASTSTLIAETVIKDTTKDFVMAL